MAVIKSIISVPVIELVESLHKPRYLHPFPENNRGSTVQPVVRVRLDDDFDKCTIDDISFETVHRNVFLLKECNYFLDKFEKVNLSLHLVDDSQYDNSLRLVASFEKGNSYMNYGKNYEFYLSPIRL